ncbi:MAG TPA: DinB family protein [Lacipirellulaceae bacterium]|nr:DinB family protein [Lacipirellulaceae bacterium]
MFSTGSIVYAWDNQLAYMLALLADLSDEQMVLRPDGAMNHPAWILGHLGLYHPVVVDLLAGRPVADAKDDPTFGFAGPGPVDDPAVYGSKAAMAERFAAGHEQVAQALLAATAADLQRPPSLERWARVYPTVEFMLPDLLLHHESLHIGQVSIWRRAAGLPAVKLPPRSVRPGLVPSR